MTESNIGDDLHSAVTMANIATLLLEDNLGGPDQSTVTGRPHTYYLSKDRVEAIMFASIETFNLIRKVQDRLDPASGRKER
jgi:hypothetical protein